VYNRRDSNGVLDGHRQNNIGATISSDFKLDIRIKERILIDKKINVKEIFNYES
jgi:hypothetical protein